MKLEKNKTYAGFLVTAAADVPDIKATAFLMEHQKSGAKLFYLQSEDDNKVFTIGFRTPSQDNTGVAHITEHSVLCGSRKYHLKEPFVELVKGSLNTFLNAMTYPDKTVYPVASRNDKDFHNLMDVYLDAVFYPLTYENPYTLMQEGWHYELAEPNNELVYNGVVYNEMKGVYSTADAIEEHEVNKALFPDTPYRFESGGLPESIPTLTQKAFTDFHKTYYSPENAYIYLYGNLDILDTLEYMDKEYLCNFPRSNQLFIPISAQESFMKTKEVEATYPVAVGEDTKGKTYLTLNIVTATALEPKTNFALKLLNAALLDGNNAPLRLALIKAGIGSDISGSFSSSMLQPIFTIKASGSDPEKIDKFISVIYSTLQKITVEGLDKELLISLLNAQEFKLREADFGIYPKGLIYGLSAMDTWLYGGDPIKTFRFTELLDFMRKKIQTRYFEKLIENYLLDNTHKVILTLKPNPGEEEKKAAAEAKKMAALKAQMDEATLAEYDRKAKTLHQRQASPDKPEDLASIPILKRTDLTRAIDKEFVEITNINQQRYLYRPGFTNKIIYTDWTYDMTGILPELLPYAFLLTDVLGKVNTKDFSYQDLSTYTNKYTGGISFQILSVVDSKNLEKYSINFSLKAKVLSENLSKLMHILQNLALSTDFSDKGRIKEILEEVKADWDANFFARGLNVATARMLAYFSPANRVGELDSYSYYMFIRELVANYEEKWPEIQENLQKLLKIIFHQDKQLFAYSCDKENKETVEKAAKEFAEMLPHSEFSGKEPVLIAAPEHNEAFETAGKVQYVVKGGDFHKHGFAYTGAMQVLATILRYGYLWTKVRVQGGAYGANAAFDPNGYAYFTSYRDPNLEATIEAYEGLPKYLANFSATEREMTKYVIGSMSLADIPLTNAMHLDRAIILELKGITDEERQNNRNQLIDTTVEDIRHLAPVVQAVLNDNYLCVVGSKNKISEAQKLFKSVKNI